MRERWWWLDRQIIDWFDKFRPHDAIAVRRWLAEETDTLDLTEKVVESTGDDTGPATTPTVTESTVQAWETEARQHANAMAARIQATRDRAEAGGTD